MRHVKKTFLAITMPFLFLSQPDLALASQSSCSNAPSPNSTLLMALAFQHMSKSSMDKLRVIEQGKDPSWPAPWPIVFKKGYNLFSSWEYNIKALNNYLPKQKFTPLTIVKHCDVKNILTPEFTTQLDTLGDLNMMKLGVTFVRKAYPGVSDAQLFTDPKYKVGVTSILVLWGLLQEYAVENTLDDNLWLYPATDQQQKINPIYGYKLLRPNSSLTIIPQEMWYYYPIYFYQMVSQSFKGVNYTPSHVAVLNFQQALKNMTLNSTDPMVKKIFLMASQPGVGERLTSIIATPMQDHSDDMMALLSMINSHANLLKSSASKAQTTVNHDEDNAYLLNKLKESTTNLEQQYFIPAVASNTKEAVNIMSENNQAGEILKDLKNKDTSKIHWHAVASALAFMDGEYSSNDSTSKTLAKLWSENYQLIVGEDAHAG